MGQIKFIGGILLFGVFAIAIVSYAIGFASDNDAVIDIADDTQLNTLNTNIKSDLGNIRINSTSSSQSFAESDIDLGSETTKTGGVFKALMTSTITPITSAYGVIQTNIFGGKGGFGVVLTALGTFLVIISLLYIWKSWKGGNPD